MKVREGVFLFGTGLGFDRALVLHAVGFWFGGLKIPFSFFVYVSWEGFGTGCQVCLLSALIEITTILLNFVNARLLRRCRHRTLFLPSLIAAYHMVARAHLANSTDCQQVTSHLTTPHCTSRHIGEQTTTSVNARQALTDYLIS
jgi:hypothetical protein